MQESEKEKQIMNTIICLNPSIDTSIQLIKKIQGHVRVKTAFIGLYGQDLVSDEELNEVGVKRGVL